MENLKNTELDMFALFEMTPDLVCIAGKDGFFKMVNPSVIKKLGYTKKELFAKPIATFVHPEDLEMTGRQRQKLLKGKSLINFQNRYVSKKGKIIWLEWTSVFLPDKEIVFAIAKDISERKHIEKEVEEKYKKFKSLAVHFKTSLEKDKRYLAVELHEELAQLASVIKIDLDSINTHEPGLSAPAKSRVEHALLISDLLINAIRRISFSISPGMLDDLGLDATLQWHCKEFSLLNGIICKFESNYTEAALTQEIKLDFFRICQEALTNVMYHAQASNVTISIEETHDRITLVINDDGRGFDVDKEKKDSGLTNMQVLANSINGDLTIKSKIGKGTDVCLTIPKHNYQLPNMPGNTD